MAKNAMFWGCLLGATAVMLGAFGAHALKSFLLETKRTEVFETAVRYHFFHAFALLFGGLLYNQKPSPLLRNALWAFLIGIVIFSGSLYALCFTQIRFFGAITPIGGILLIVGWLLCAWVVLSSSPERSHHTQ